MKAAIYARYSSDKQNVASVEAQIRACQEYAERQGHLVVSIYSDEAVSGKGEATHKRKDYQRLLRDSGKGLFDLILIHKYDRVARNLHEHVVLEMKLAEHHITLVAVEQDFGSSKEAKIMKSLMWSLSEYYIDNLAEEVKKGHRETALKGLHNGGYPPFGYDVVEQRYVINESEAEYVRKMFASAAACEGFTALIQEMAAAGITGKRGKPIKYPQIYEILRNKKYTGVYYYSIEEEKDRKKRRSKEGAIKVRGAIPAIVDQQQFEEVQKIMDSRKQTGGKGNYLCSGMVYCANCGAKMHGFTSKKGPYEYSYFACSKKCGMPRIRMDEVDKAAVKYLRDLLSEDNQRRIGEALQNYMSGERSRVADFNTQIRQEIEEKQRQFDIYMERLGSPEQFPPGVMKQIGEKMQALKDEMELLAEQQPPKDYTDKQILDWLEAIKKAPDETGVYLLVDKIEVDTRDKKMALNLQSKLSAIFGTIDGCGSSLYSILPKILFEYRVSR